MKTAGCLSGALVAALALVSGCASIQAKDPKKLAIDRAVTWLQQVPDALWRHDIPAMTQFLQRRFARADLESMHRRVSRPPAEPVEDDLDPLYFRLLDGRVGDDLNRLSSIGPRRERVVLPALYCDVRPLPSDYADQLTALATRGGYDLTHAVLARVWLLENDCSTAEKQQAALGDLAQPLRRLASSEDAFLDLRIEAMAMLYYAGFAELVQEQWIELVASTQRPDGGWAVVLDGQDSHPHTTFLALWVLLEATADVKRPVPMIPRL